MQLKRNLLVLSILLGCIHLVSGQQNTYFDQQPVWKIYTQNAHEYPCVRNMNRNQFLGNPVNYDTLTFYPLFERYTLEFGWESDQEPYPFCHGEQSADSLFRGYVRSFGKRIYFRRGLTLAEYLIYDFNLSIGDTLPLNELLHSETLVVTAIDSVLVSGGNYWKVFTVTGNNYVSQLIEGVGSSAGFLEELEKPYNVSHALECYSQNGQKYFPELETPDCIFFLDLKEPELKVSIYPNPCSDKLHVSMTTAFSNCFYRITCMDGTTVVQGSVSSQELDIETEKWSSGVYLLEFYSDNGKLSRQKIIKQ